MLNIQARDVPDETLLSAYRDKGAFTDCFTTTIDGSATLEQYIESFYTTWLFKLERFILRIAVNRPSTDHEAHLLATGAADTFAAWAVEDREAAEILLCDFQGRTRSWLMIQAPDQQAGSVTTLFFGSAVIPQTDRESENRSIGKGFSALMWFHKVYSVLLLFFARRSLIKTCGQRV